MYLWIFCPQFTDRSQSDRPDAGGRIVFCHRHGKCHQHSLTHTIVTKMSIYTTDPIILSFLIFLARLVGPTWTETVFKAVCDPGRSRTSARTSRRPSEP